MLHVGYTLSPETGRWPSRKHQNTGQGHIKQTQECGPMAIKETQEAGQWTWRKSENASQSRKPEMQAALLANPSWRPSSSSYSYSYPHPHTSSSLFQIAKPHKSKSTYGVLMLLALTCSCAHDGSSTLSPLSSCRLSPFLILTLDCTCSRFPVHSINGPFHASSSNPTSSLGSGIQIWISGILSLSRD